MNYVRTKDPSVKTNSLQDNPQANASRRVAVLSLLCTWHTHYYTLPPFLLRFVSLINLTQDSHFTGPQWNKGGGMRKHSRDWSKGLTH